MSCPRATASTVSAAICLRELGSPREVVLLSLAIGADIFGRHQPGIVTERCEFAAQVMCADAGFHIDQARRYIGEPRFHLFTRPFLPQHDGAAPIVAHDVERVLADIDADHGNRGAGWRLSPISRCGGPLKSMHDNVLTYPVLRTRDWRRRAFASLRAAPRKIGNLIMQSKRNLI